MGRERRAPTNWRQRFKRGLHDRFLLRFHMFLITAAVLLSGVIISRALWKFGLRAIDVRYPIAVACSYLFFFVLIRIWLLYIAAADADDETAFDEEDAVDGIEVMAAMVPSNGFGGGGGSGGSGGGGSSSSIGNLFDGADEGGYVLIVLGVVLVAVFGSSLYLIWEAPTVLGEAALQMVLAGSLTRAARRINEPGWAGSVLGATWIPFVIVLVLTAIFASVASHYCPGASRMSEILQACGTR